MQLRGRNAHLSTAHRKTRRCGMRRGSSWATLKKGKRLVNRGPGAVLDYDLGGLGGAGGGHFDKLATTRSYGPPQGLLDPNASRSTPPSLRWGVQIERSLDGEPSRT